MKPSKPVYDVIVIGAGIEGSSCAYNLVKRGKTVLLLEQFPLPHIRGSSHGQSRNTKYAHDSDFYVRMMVDAFSMWATLEREAGENFFINCGVLYLRSKERFIRPVLSALSAYDIPHELLTASEIRRRYPGIAVADTDLAVYDPSGGALRADRALAAFQRIFQQLGGTIYDNEAVSSIKPGSPTKVVTSRAVYAASYVVIAAGPWTGQFVSALGLHLPLTTTRVTSLYWNTKSGLKSVYHCSNLPCVIDHRSDSDQPFGPHTLSHVYVMPSLDCVGKVKLTNQNSVPCDPDRRDHGNEREEALIHEATTEAVKAKFPGLEPTPAIKENSPDNNPIIDRHPHHPNIIIAAGFSGHGFKLAPAVGKMVTEMVTGANLTYDVKPFRIGRFDPEAKL